MVRRRLRSSSARTLGGFGRPLCTGAPMADPIVIVGCGGHGREILGIIPALHGAFGEPWKVLGFVDDGPSEVNLERVDSLGVPYLGPASWLASAGPGTHYVV